MAGPRELVKVSMPVGVPDWFQAVAADLTKTLARMQQQVDEQAGQIATLQQYVAAHP